MTLIVDSGSTKSDFIWIEKSEIIRQTQVAGINPFYQTEEDIFSTINDVCSDEMKRQTHFVYFYGAGCAFKEKCDMVRRPLQNTFPNASVEVHNDLLGAALSLFNRNEGIACILGTGSNSCHYDGKEIIKNVSPLGFILGDEGSGAVIGKRLVSDILKGLVSTEISERFFLEENTSPATLMENIYKRPFPNRFLAQFSKHVYNHKEEPYFHQFLLDCFHDFFRRNINQYPKHLQIGCIGSIAFYFQKELTEVAEINGRQVSAIMKSPLDGLVQYHTK